MNAVLAGMSVLLRVGTLLQSTSEAASEYRYR